jgi:fucose 4-O-acetylase-like acetyltransferase
MKISAESSEKIKAIGFLCALLVVPIHCPTISRCGEASWWIVALQTVGCDTISRLAVPWFFITSGFFLALGFQKSGTQLFTFTSRFHLNSWISVIRKRFVSLLIPYFLWNIIYYLFKLSTGKYGFDPFHALHQLIGYNPYEVPACGQLWYVRCLFMYVLLAPAFWWACGGVETPRPAVRSWLVVAAFYLAWFVGVPLPWKYMQFTDWSYLAYFATGFALASQEGLRDAGWGIREKGFLGLFFVSAVIVVYAKVAGCLEIAVWANKAMIVSGLPTLWFAGDWVVKVVRPVKEFWGFGFFIYASHVIFVSIARKTFAIGLHGNAYDSIGYVGVIVTAIICPIIIGVVMKKNCPKVLGLLCGGRV